MRLRSLFGGVALGVTLLTAQMASAALVGFNSYTGNVALSTDGIGTVGGNGVISASAPAGSTVVAAFLYTATFSSSTVPTTVTLEGSPVTFTNTAPNATACCNLRSHRADVTSVVASVINGGAGGVYDFDYAEGGNNSFIDGSALVVVYRNPSLPAASVGLLDGFADVDGDTTTVNFADALNPAAPGFFAEMVLGIGFSCCDPSSSTQSSRVEVNGMLLTENAGLNDDSIDATAENGNLFTIGSFDDGFSPALPSYGEDRERYDLSSFVTAGDTSIVVETFNASEDDNIFFAGFYVQGRAGFDEPPPPPSEVPLPAGGLLLLTGLAGLAVSRRKKSN